MAASPRSVLWRNIDQMDNDALDKWFEKQDDNTREMVYDVFYVNGDNNLENLRRPDSDLEGAADRGRIRAAHIRRERSVRAYDANAQENSCRGMEVDQGSNR